MTSRAGLQAQQPPHERRSTIVAESQPSSSAAKVTKRKHKTPSQSIPAATRSIAELPSSTITSEIAAQTKSQQKNNHEDTISSSLEPTPLTFYPKSCYSLSPTYFTWVKLSLHDIQHRLTCRSETKGTSITLLTSVKKTNNQNSREHLFLPQPPNPLRTHHRLRRRHHNLRAPHHPHSRR